MKKIATYILAASLICFIYACNKNEENTLKGLPALLSIKLTEMQIKKANADNAISFKMFGEVSAMYTDNTFFSPLSLNMALGMLYNGASGDTRAEMAEVLGFADFTDTEINEYYQTLSQALLNADKETEIGIANSIWYHNTYPVKQSFIDINKKYFDAEVTALDFSKSDAVKIINKWCADKTNNRIDKIIESTSGNLVFLINALYFKGEWWMMFDVKKTKQDNFTKTDNKKIKVNMMEQTAFLPYYSDEYIQSVEMPYGNGAFSMVAILPSNDIGIDQLIGYLDNTVLQKAVNMQTMYEVQVKFPRFKVECEMENLMLPLYNVGLKKIYGGSYANISDAPLGVSQIIQKTFVEVDEKGTEAAAVTLIGMTGSSGNNNSAITYPKAQFFANRPFLYLIKERSTGVILFIGRMDEPEE